MSGNAQRESPTRAESGSGPDPRSRRARSAVTALFLVNAMAYASVVPWLPTIKRELTLSNAELGAAIAGLPLGALLLGMVAGPLIARFGSARTSVVSAAVLVSALPLVAVAPGWWALTAVFMVMGSADAWMDSAMNAHGLRVQRRYGRSIIVTFHAVWSVGAVTAGLLGATAAGLGVPLVLHLGSLAVVLVGLAVTAVRFTLPGPEHAERDDGSDSARPRDLLRSLTGAAGLLGTLGVLLMLAGAVEDSAASWGAVYMSGELGASAFLAGLPFVACQTLMTVGRLTGDRLTDRFGAVAVARTGALLAAVGLGAALLVPSPVTTIVGFGLSGLGISTLFPLGLAAGGHIPGVRSGDGVAVVAWLARVGFLCFPPVVGAIADATSLRAGLALIPVAGLVVAVLAGSLRPHERDPDAAAELTGGTS